MKRLQFKNGDTIPSIGLGTWKAQGDEVKKAIMEAVEAGYRHIDTAAVYENEAAIGEALTALFDKGIVQREDLFITSKLWNDAHHPDDVEPALQDSLRKLQLDYLDLYLIHWPVAFKKGVSFPSEATDYIPLHQLPSSVTWKAMEKVKQMGLAKHIGVSNFSEPKLKELIGLANEAPEVNQVELHPLLQQESLFNYCKNQGIILTGYSPLGSGDRSAQMKASDEPNLFDIPEIRSIAQKHNIHPAEVLIAWHTNRGTTVIPKSTTTKNILSNLKASELALNTEDMETLASMDRNYRFINGKFFELPGSGYSNIYDE